VDRINTGAYAGVRLSREQMKEIRYAALLHDFGKVGVREEVLVKAKKLYPLQLDLVRQRFDYIRKELEARVTRQKLQTLLERTREEAQARIGGLDEEYEQNLREIDDYFQFILQVNEPSILHEGNFDKLIQIARRSFLDPRGIEQPFLKPEEIRYLSIPKGSLDANERSQIESHVIHTFNFLTQIPWTKELKEVPRIARAHHEKLNGTGYPYRLHGDEIPLPTKMMTICDIFDALSASDRPYKKSVPVERALAILDASVRQNQLDSELFRLFLDAKIYERTIKQR
jgi:response regulator RpfG family c-di-GMP phosphodiesterase